MSELADGIADKGSAEAACERFCIATRTVHPVTDMIRFVAGPGGALVPDLKRRLPGRGVWVTARRRLVEDAVKRQAFAHGLKANVRVPVDLADTLDGLLERWVLDALSVAHKAGLTLLGFARIEAARNLAGVVALLRAHDRGADSAGKLARLRWGDRDPVKIEVFTSAQLDLAVGRLNVVHAALLAGRASETFLERWRILQAFRAEA